MKQGYVYLLASKRNGTLYIGVTANLPQRIMQHKSREASSFTARYNVTQLVYYEEHPTMMSAIVQEKRYKKLTRKEKLALIESINPDWRDLTDTCW